MELISNKLTEQRARLRDAAKNYQSTLSWYEATPDSPNAEQDCYEVTAAFKRVIGHRETDIIADLLDEIEELQERRCADAAQKPVAWTDAQELRDVEKHGCGYLFTVNPITPDADPRRVIKLYAEPQPLGGLDAQHCKHLLSALEHLRKAFIVAVGEKSPFAKLALAPVDKAMVACRAAMLKGGAE